MYSKKRGVVLLRIIKARFQAVSKISTEKALFIEEFPAETKEFLQHEACCCRKFWKNINQIFLLRDHLGIDIRCFSHIWTNIFMHFHMMNKRNSISTYFIYRNIYFFFKFNFEFVLNIFQISSIYYLLETNYNFKEIVLALDLFLIQVCLKIRTREEVGITDRLSTRMELASIEVRNHPFSCLPHFNAVLTATFHDSSLLSPNRSRNSLSRRRFSRSYLFEGKN